MVPGPFPYSPDIAGNTIIRVDSREKAIGWSMRYPNPAGVLAAARESNGIGPRVRIGLHAGTVRDADDFYGKALILTARIASEARGAEILASSLRELTASSGEFIFEPATEAELRGLSGIHQVSAVRWQDA